MSNKSLEREDRRLLGRDAVDPTGTNKAGHCVL
jgi:hypothetical protein